MKINKPKGKLGILIPGMGAVASTFIAGVEAIKKGIAVPIGSMTQMGTIRLGKRTENRVPLIKDFAPLASLDDLVFGGWDINEESLYEICIRSKVLNENMIEALQENLDSIDIWPAVFDKKFVKNIDGDYVKKAKNKMELAEKIIEDINMFSEK
ncbi:uncharacterized protein METZ01_LOCUS223855, partial [marine metagenome]